MTQIRPTALSEQICSLADMAPANLLFTTENFYIQHINEQALKALSEIRENSPDSAGLGTHLRELLPESSLQSIPDDFTGILTVDLPHHRVNMHVSESRSWEGSSNGRLVVWTAHGLQHQTANKEALLLEIKSALIQGALNCPDINQALIATLETLSYALQPVSANLWIRNTSTEKLNLIESFSEKDNQNSKLASASNKEGIPGKTWQKRKILISHHDDIKQDPRRSELLTAGIEGAVSFPVIYAGRFHGVIELHFNEAIDHQRSWMFYSLGGIISAFIGHCHCLQSQRVAMTDCNFLTNVTEALEQADSPKEAIELFYETACNSFDWNLTTHWMVENEASDFIAISGDILPQEFCLPDNIKPTAGVLAAITNNDVALITNLELTESNPITDYLQEQGYSSSISLYIDEGNGLARVIEFYTSTATELSVSRWNTLRSATALLEQAIQKKILKQEIRELDEDRAVLNGLMKQLPHAKSVEEGIKICLDCVRSGYGWKYGSFWKLNESTERLEFHLDSGEVSQDFRQATMNSTFAKGVGLAGRTWKSGKINFTNDLSKVTDCSRAPAALSAGVKTGLCFPIYCHGKLEGTIDMFALEEFDLSEQRRNTLGNIQDTISGFLDRLCSDAIAEERRENDAALKSVLEALSSAVTPDEVIMAALNCTRDSFRWDYASFWALDEKGEALKFSLESGSVSEEFQKATLAASFEHGVGLSGKTWQAMDLVFVDDLGSVTDCCRAPAARSAGVKAGVCFPITVAGELRGTMDFFVLHSIALSDERRAALKSVGELVSQALTRNIEAERIRESKENTTAVNTVLAKLTEANSTTDALQAALNTVRSEFGWAYASFWKRDPKENVLKFQQQSGTVNPEFQKVTEEASFAKGVGLSGRTWLYKELFFVRDIGEMVDCCRAPIAQAVGVKSGVCFPIIIDDEVYGTMDFFATETLELTEDRLNSLKSIGKLVSSRMTQLLKEEEERHRNEELKMKVKIIQENLKKAAAGDLRVQIEIEQGDAIGEVAHSAQLLITGMRESISLIAESSTALAGAAEELAAVSTQMKSNVDLTAENSVKTAVSADEVNDSVVAVSAGTEEMSASIKEISTNASKASEVAFKAVQSAGNAGKLVKSLDESAQEVESVLKFITFIASQTNLLALNATIESARAGKVGKGFAVVANEVKKLAGQTADATESIEELLGGIQKNTQSVASAIDDIHKIIETVHDISSSIASAVEEQNATTLEISQSIQQAAVRTEEISESAQVVAAAAGQTTDGAEQTLQASRELSTMAHDLQGLVSRFSWN